MDSKRKANGNTTPDDERAKRRKISEDYDLAEKESAESTSAYGLSFLEQIRRTSDKSGRKVATCFETLLPKEGNEEYYKQTKMPISLKMIEVKLNNGEFKNLTELESYFKRMICNAKDFFPRSSPTFDDAERVRKAVSNYMTKTNPAYQNDTYQAFPTPFPLDDEENPAEEDENAENNSAKGEETNKEEETKDESNDEDEDESGEPESKPAEQTDAEEDDDSSPKKRSIILKRRAGRPGKPGRPGRPYKNPQDAPRKPSLKPDHEYGDKGYKGLSFQQAQEKIVEEMLRHQDPEYEGPYFEPFVNLPPRALRDYYKMISDPLSLKKLQKAVRGQHGRNDPTGVSEFKSWAQFEEKAQLLWNNAYYYNEEGSEIYTVAQALEKFFQDHLKQASAVVPEPPQPKIKLKVGQQAEPSGSSRKITINVASGSGRGVSSESPTPGPTASVASPAANGTPTTHTQTTLAPIEKARSVSISIASPSPSVRPGIKDEQVKAGPVRQPSTVSAPMTPGVVQPTPSIQPEAQPAPPPVPTTPMEQKRLRGPGKGVKNALISRVHIQTSNQHNISERPVVATILPDPQDMQQSVTINLPGTHNRFTMSTLLPEFLQKRHYNLWTLLDGHALKPSYQPHVQQNPHERVFEAILHPGVNVIETHLFAAIPIEERVSGRPQVELEVFTVFVNVMRN